MGCDIHLFVEYREANEWRRLGQFRPGRDYHMFGLLAGVRDDSVEAVVEPRGFPEDASFDAWLANMSVRTDDGELDADGMSRLRVARTVGADVGHLVTPCSDWHSHSWLDAEELAAAIKAYPKGLPKGERQVNAAWHALHALLHGLPEGRMVFFFDN